MSLALSRSQLLVVTVWAALLALMLAVPAAAEPSKNASELDGTWKLVSVEQEGEVMERDDDVRLVIKEGQVFYAGEPLAALATYAASTPKGLDLSLREPKNDYEGIYALDKDELKICLNTRTTGPKDRPFDFATKGKSDLRVLKFEGLAPAAVGVSTAPGFVGMGLAVENESVVIADVIEKSPAEKAGLRAGDVLVSVGGEVVKKLQPTVDSVRRQTPGSDLTIRVLRDGKEKEIVVRVGVFPFAFLGILG